MGTIRKRGKYYWYFSGTGKSRKQLSLNPITHRAPAERIRQKLDLKKGLAQFGIVDPELISLQNMRNEWFSFLRQDSHSASWFADEIQHNTRLIAFLGPDTIATSISPKDINMYIKFHEDKAPNTINNYLKIPRQLFDYGVTNAYMESNPISGANVPEQVAEKDFLPIPIDIFHKVIHDDTIKESHRDFWMLCYLTGLSPGDAGRITKDHIHNIHGHKCIVMKRQKLKHKSGKMAKKPPKAVVIPMKQKLIDMGASIYSMKPTISNLSTSSRALKRACEKHGFENACLKCLRPTTLTNMFNEGESLEEVQLLAGWSTKKMAQRYVRADIERRVKAFGVLSI
jgi:integrase